jgi:protein-tyrosine phosphatase
MAAALLARRISDAGVRAEIRSAGILGPGEDAWPEAAVVMAEHGLDLSEHTSRRLDKGAVAGADLVLGMTREHVREAVVLEPQAFQRSFTLKELVRRGMAMPRGDEPALATWLASLSAGRDVSELLGASADDDLADPIGSPLPAFRDTAAEIDHLVTRLVAIAWPRTVPRSLRVAG